MPLLLSFDGRTTCWLEANQPPQSVRLFPAVHAFLFPLRWVTLRSALSIASLCPFHGTRTADPRERESWEGGENVSLTENQEKGIRNGHNTHVSKFCGGDVMCHVEAFGGVRSRPFLVTLGAGAFFGETCDRSNCLCKFKSLRDLASFKRISGIVHDAQSLLSTDIITMTTDGSIHHREPYPRSTATRWRVRTTMAARERLRVNRIVLPSARRPF
jgi:hypothetical protein